MTPQIRAAADELRDFLKQADTDGIYDHTPVLDITGYQLTFGQLRTLLAALDPAEQPIPHIPTKAGLNYLATRRRQNPKERAR